MTTYTGKIASTKSQLTSYMGQVKIVASTRELFSTIWSNQQSIRIMRFALGVTLAVAFSAAIDWPLAFLLPILTSVLLAMPIPRPTLKAIIGSMLFTVMAFTLGLVFAIFLLPYPMAYILLLGLALFNIYYLVNRGGPFWLALMSLLAVLILPVLGNVQQGLAFGVAMGFIISGWLTMAMVWIAHLMVPDLPDAPKPPKKPPMKKGFVKPAAQAALKSTIVVLPLVIMFVSFDLANQILVMVFAAIFTLQPDIAKGKEAGVNSLKSTVIGGMFAFVFYQLIVIVSVYHFFVVLMFLTTLYFGSVIFSDKPKAPLYASAFSTLYVLVNSSLGEGANFTSAFLLRFLFIFLATVYVVYGLMLFERYWPQRKVDSG